MASYNLQLEDVFDRPMVAKYAGRCSACGKGFRAGDAIRWVKNVADTKPHAYCADAVTCAASLLPASLVPESDQGAMALLLQNGDTNAALKMKMDLESAAVKNAEQAAIDEVEALLKEMD